MTEPEEWIADTWRMIEQVAQDQRGEVHLTPAGCMALLKQRNEMLAEIKRLKR